MKCILKKPSHTNDNVVELIPETEAEEFLLKERFYPRRNELSRIDYYYVDGKLVLTISQEVSDDEE